jgi:hypothetical protein
MQKKYGSYLCTPHGSLHDARKVILVFFEILFYSNEKLVALYHATRPLNETKTVKMRRKRFPKLNI